MTYRELKLKVESIAKEYGVVVDGLQVVVGVGPKAPLLCKPATLVSAAPELDRLVIRAGETV